MENIASITCRVDKIQRTDTLTKNTDKEEYTMVGKDADGIQTVRITKNTPWEGLKPDETFDIIIKKSQTSIEDFNKAKQDAKESE